MINVWGERMPDFKINMWKLIPTSIILAFSVSTPTRCTFVSPSTASRSIVVSASGSAPQRNLSQPRLSIHTNFNPSNFFFFLPTNKVSPTSPHPNRWPYLHPLYIFSDPPHSRSTIHRHHRQHQSSTASRPIDSIPCQPLSTSNISPLHNSFIY